MDYDSEGYYSDEEQEGGYKKKRTKMEGQHTIPELIFGRPKSKPSAKPAVPKATQKHMEDASKELMNSLLNSYDNPETEDVPTIMAKVALNKYQEYEQVYNTPLVGLEAPKPEPPTSHPEPMQDTEDFVEPPKPVAKAPEPKPAANSGLKRTHEEFVSKVPPPTVEEPVPEVDGGNYERSVERFKVDTVSVLTQAQSETLVGNSDGSLDFYWIDAFEEPNNHNEVYLIGKVLVGKKYSTCCLLVRGLERCLYFVPKSLAEMKSPKNEDFNAMFMELEELRKKKYPGIQKWRTKIVTRKYNFELPIMQGENKFLKAKYSYKYPALPSELSGENFACVLGTTTSMLENLLIKRKFWGPSWIKLKKYTVPSKKASWCRFEIAVDSPKDIIVESKESRREAPPLSILSLSIKHYNDRKSGKNAIAVITGLLDENVSMDKPAQTNRVNPIRFSLACPCGSHHLPADLSRQARIAKVNVTDLPNEKNMLTTFLTKMVQLDPDAIVGHDLYGHTLDLIISRIRYFNISALSQIGRLKAVSLPKTYSSYQCRVATVGRLLCDTFLSAKDMLPKEANYTLPHLAKKELGEELEEFDNTMLPDLLQGVGKALQVIKHTEKEAYVSLKLLHKLAVLPLTKQLANIAGHLWIRSLQNARAERNEMLLMHTFHDKKYILPDRNLPSAKKRPGATNAMDDEETQEKLAKKGRKKAAYEGGLVLEPQSGFYDRYILLLDFQSLYPSIIQEFNICFTTVKRACSQKLPAKKSSGKTEEAGGAQGDESEIIGKLPDKDVERGILPGVLENLVRQRREVKKQLAASRDPLIQQQCDIKQRALKLSANSMYGCLGFTNSRFYAKPIAALITKKGRDTLKRAHDLATKELNLHVIYGDTDSLMINSNKEGLEDALEIAKKLKGEINKAYSKLEIEIDGVFKSLLLLKKKKYAALKLKNPFDERGGTTIDIKGLDMVRRDWCQLTKVLSDEVLKELLSGKNSEEIAAALNKKFAEYGSKLQQRQLKLSQFIITKQLTKSVSEYKDAQRQPHVRVAQALIKKGEGEANLIGHFIPYVICKGEPMTQFADRAYHPSEVQSQGLEVDIAWYATQQILPPLQRLLEYLREFNLDDLPMHFGLDPKEHKITRIAQDFQIIIFRYREDTEKAKEDEELPETVDEQTPLNPAKKLIIPCPQCHKEMDLQSSAALKIDFTSIQCTNALVCYSVFNQLQCNYPIKAEYIRNKMAMLAKACIKDYYKPILQCSDPSCKNAVRYFSRSTKYGQDRTKKQVPEMQGYQEGRNK
eukprot:TRINITY_DN1143_c0_g1_i1.p1 TRINITY_DN1143_c0_g1~~TRINITY_DN1143_c0_g1_i1.p1  ORF type:complete len:1280 (+),score=197.21 TRINITY_DN1143_c0_g1_i1:7245-11084(+)